MGNTRAAETVSGIVLATSLASATPSDPIDTKFADNVNFMVNITDKQSATTITVRPEWSLDGTTWGPQQTGATPSSGDSAIEDYSETRAITANGAFPVDYPTRGKRWVRLVIAVDNVTGPPTVSVKVQRG